MARSVAGANKGPGGGGTLSGPIHLPPTGATPDLMKLTMYCLEYGQELVVIFDQPGDLTIADDRFFRPGPFPQGAFGEKSELTGYLPKKNNSEVLLTFTYKKKDGSAGGKKTKAKVLVQVRSGCPVL